MVGPLPPKFGSPIQPFAPVNGEKAGGEVSDLTAADAKACETAAFGSIKQSVSSRLAARSAGSVPLSNRFNTKEASSTSAPRKIGDHSMVESSDEPSEQELKGGIESSIGMLPVKQRAQAAKTLNMILSKGTSKERRGLLKSFGSSIASLVERHHEQSEGAKEWRTTDEPLLEMPGHKPPGSYPIPQEIDNELILILMKMRKLPSEATGKYQPRLQEIRSGNTPDVRSLLDNVMRDVDEDLKQFA